MTITAKNISFFLISIFLTINCFGQKDLSFKEVHEYIIDYGDNPYKYVNDLLKVSEKDKDYTCALYLLHIAYKNEVEESETKTNIDHLQVLLDSSLLFLNNTRKRLNRNDFAKQTDYFAPLIASYGIYESKDQLFDDLVSQILLNERELIIKKNRLLKVKDAFNVFFTNYSNLLKHYSALISQYPNQNDILLLSDLEYEGAIQMLKNALDQTEEALMLYNNSFKGNNIDEPIDIKRQSVQSYLINVKNMSHELMQNGIYFDFKYWFGLIENARLEKIGDFWQELFSLHAELERNIDALNNSVSPKNQIELDSRIIDKIKYIDAESALIPYLAYLEAKKDLLANKIQTRSANLSEVYYVNLHQYLQKCKFNLQLLDQRIKNGNNERNKLLFQHLAKTKDDLLIFLNTENNFVLEKEIQISNELKSLLVDDFISYRFKPSFVNYQSLILATYQQNINTVLKQGKSLTTNVNSESANAQLIAGSLYTTSTIPFVASIKDKQVQWLTKSFISKNDFNLPSSIDYFHCTLTFFSNAGVGAVFYPGKYGEENNSENQEGILLLFNNNGQLQRKIALPYSKRITKALTVTDGSGYVLLAENEYLADSYFPSEIIFVNNDGSIKWRKNLSFKTFDSKLSNSENGILLFSNTIQDIPGNDHIKSEVKVLSFNSEGGILMEKDMPTTSSRFASMIQKDESGRWFIFGFIGNNDLYNLREKDVFFYLLDHSFDDLGGGELTSAERP